MEFNLVRVTGAVALGISVLGLVAPRDQKMLRLLSVSALLWAWNNFLIGAMTACALSALSALRSATCSHIIGKPSKYRLPACLAFCATALGAGAFTWVGVVSIFPLVGTLLSTVSNFFLTGVGLRLVVAVSNLFWLAGSIHYRAWEQIVSLCITLLASCYGIWQAHQAAASQTRELQMLSPPL
jgi:hypothetical protein